MLCFFFQGALATLREHSYGFSKQLYVSSSYGFESGPGGGSSSFQCKVACSDCPDRHIVADCPVPFGYNSKLCKVLEGSEGTGSGEGWWYAARYLPLVAGTSPMPALSQMKNATLSFWVESNRPLTLQVQAVNDTVPDSMDMNASHNDCWSICNHPQACYNSCKGAMVGVTEIDVPPTHYNESTHEYKMFTIPVDLSAGSARYLRIWPKAVVDCWGSDNEAAVGDPVLKWVSLRDARDV